MDVVDSFEFVNGARSRSTFRNTSSSRGQKFSIFCEFVANRSRDVESVMRCHNTIQIPII